MKTFCVWLVYFNVDRLLWMKTTYGGWLITKCRINPYLVFCYIDAFAVSNTNSLMRHLLVSLKLFPLFRFFLPKFAVDEVSKLAADENNTWDTAADSARAAAAAAAASDVSGAGSSSGQATEVCAVFNVPIHRQATIPFRNPRTHRSLTFKHVSTLFRDMIVVFSILLYSEQMKTTFRNTLITLWPSAYNTVYFPVVTSQSRTLIEL